MVAAIVSSQKLIKQVDSDTNGIVSSQKWMKHMDSDSSDDGESDPDSVLSIPVRHFHDDHTHPAWDIKSSIAFWISAWTVEGAALFTLGSVFLYPGLVPESEGKEYVERAWVDYPFMIGAWCFTVANFLCYFQVINRGHDHQERSQRRFLLPSEWHGGTVAALLNCCGAVLFNICTMEMFFPGVRKRYGLRSWNFWYVCMGGGGSAFFVAAGAIQGEYNKWRQLKLSAPVVISHMNFWGGVLFLVAYVVDWNHLADKYEPITVWGVATPFTVGSAFFMIAAFAELWMWKTENFGLGFAISLRAPQQREVKRQIDMTAMFFISLYFSNICMSWVRFGFVFASDSYRNTFGLTIIHKLVVYHFLLFVISVYHKIPREHPYDILVYVARAIAVFGAIAESIQIAVIIYDYRSEEAYHCLA